MTAWNKTIEGRKEEEKEEKEKGRRRSYFPSRLEDAFPLIDLHRGKNKENIVILREKAGSGVCGLCMGRNCISKNTKHTDANTNTQNKSQKTGYFGG
jgi:hypothetical protein